MIIFAAERGILKSDSSHPDIPKSFTILDRTKIIAR